MLTSVITISIGDYECTGAGANQPRYLNYQIGLEKEGLTGIIPWMSESSYELFMHKIKPRNFP